MEGVALKRLKVNKKDNIFCLKYDAIERRGERVWQALVQVARDNRKSWRRGRGRRQSQEEKWSTLECQSAA